ncbi:endonuclease/exonuclease/phosphatase family protein [Citricoccus sp. SGAir0253]|uniref:endonuclease/exonuclease/phosphatase family protein n=1 Tax=Citricoccus sp. SGAir0253 TaxID=2567881 RepID=UPI0010CD38D0|nr:endonuclease/exonuclease/phosphatase family protein [Citricoccus sp. SGAir0253]QCU76874.1 endonuclease/exonuclease/phosphatase family protein [Citricoccus sp. SGAir0253]
MSASLRRLRRRVLLGGALVPVAAVATALGIPGAAAAPGPEVHAAMVAGRDTRLAFDLDDALPEHPDLVRRLQWMRAGEVPAARPGDLRVATFSAGLSRSVPGRLAEEVSAPGSERAERVAETVQRAAPDVVLLTDVDVDGGDEAARDFRTNYLAVGTGGQEGIDYPYVYTAEVNNGVDTGADLDDDGVIGGTGDSFGPGEFAGQHGMVLYSRYPLDTGSIRTFRDLRWDEMPYNALPEDDYTELERSVLRLSSTAHWDIPVRVGGRTVHVLASQPVDPASGESSAARHHDEMRFWSDYVTGRGDYITDDAGRSGGLARDSDFVLAGTFGDRTGTALDEDHPSAIRALLDAEVIRDPEPESAGARAADRDEATATHAVRDGEGELVLDRTDFVLPSASLSTSASGVFWPLPGQLGSHLTPTGGDADRAGLSEHRLVWADVTLG